MPKPPIFLEGYDAFEDLTKWYLGNREEGRDWEIRPYGRGIYLCRLSWKFDASGSTQLGSLEDARPTPQEAVFWAIHKFAAWKEEYERQRGHVKE